MQSVDQQSVVDFCQFLKIGHIKYPIDDLFDNSFKHRTMLEPNQMVSFPL